MIRTKLCLLASVLLACAVTTPEAAGAPSSTVDGRSVVDWNVIALRTTAAAPFDPPRETRSLAIVQAAVYDAVVAATDDGTRPYAVAVHRPRRGSAAAAVAAAAHDVLAGLYDAQRPALDASFDAYLAGLPTGRARDDGVRIGRATAQAMLALRADDRSDDVVTYTPQPGPGKWQPTPPAYLPALDPGWGRVTPFLVRRVVLPPAPPAVGSTAYQRDLAEIRQIGAVDSVSRTAEQTATARFWVATAPQLWNQPLQGAAAGMPVVRAARAFAMLNLVGADAFITAWKGKYHFAQWRPVTAIRATVDPAWTPLLGTPPFPDYPSAHAVYAGAAETVLSVVLGRHPLDITSPGIGTHHYRNAHAVADEVMDARVWGGVHWRTSDTVGRTLGRGLAHGALSHLR